MRTFRMIRQSDESKYSGTGEVLQGVIFDNGKTVIQWCVPEKPNSIAIYNSFPDFKEIHIDSHPTNKTIIEFFKGEKDGQWVQDVPPKEASPQGV